MSALDTLTPGTPEQNYFTDILVRSAKSHAVEVFNRVFGLPDTSTVEVDGETQLKPFVAMIQEDLRGDNGRVIVINTDLGEVVKLVSKEEQQHYTSMCDVAVLERLNELMRKGRDNSAKGIFDRAMQLIADAEAGNCVVKLNMPSPGETAKFQTKASVTVSDSSQSNNVLYHPTDGPYWR
jgi:hypothetical protein